MQALVDNRCRLCGHKLLDGELFCDPTCEEEYHESICLKCEKPVDASNSHTVDNSDNPDWIGRRICKECWEGL